jgi:hypothetical protein
MSHAEQNDLQAENFVVMILVRYSKTRIKITTR